MRGSRTYAVELEDLDVTSQGVRDFFWPVSYQERKTIKASLIALFVDHLEKLENQIPGAALPIKLLFCHLITESLAVINYKIFEARCKKHYKFIGTNSNWRLWDSFVNNQVPADSPLVRQLMGRPISSGENGAFAIFRKVWRARKSLRFRNGVIQINGLSLRRLDRRLLKTSIVATRRSALIEAHAELDQRDIIFRGARNWFRSVSEEDLHQHRSPAVDNHFLCSFVSEIADLAFACGARDFDVADDYLKRFFWVSISAVSTHYARLLEQPDRLPTNIWTGSGGNIWDATLRYACLQCHDGEVVGHDHGAGLGHVDYSWMAFYELWGCKEFICLNGNQARELAKNSKKWQFLETQSSKLSGWQSNQSIKRTTQSHDVASDSKTVIVLATTYARDQLWAGPCSPDIVHVDWQARVIGKLRSWGYSVILKVHPESFVAAPKALSQLQAEVIDDPLESVLHRGDIVLFDCLHTTAFRSVLTTDMPMVMIDFHDHPWTDHARQLFNRRSPLIPGYFDSLNRAQIDWGLLESGLEASEDLAMNSEFFHYYYG